MTTTSHASTARPGTAGAPVGRVPFPRLLRVELQKMVASRAGGWLLTAVGLALVAIVALRLLTGEADELTFRGFAEVTSTPLSLLLPLLAILSVTTEWSQRTALGTFTLEPSRVRVVLGKLAAVVALGLLAVAAALAAAAVGNALGAALQEGSGDWSASPSDIGELALTQLVAVVQGFAFGLLLRSTSAAIVLYYLVAPALSTVLTLFERLEGAAGWLDLSTALVPLSAGTASGQDWAQAASAAALWLLLPMGLGLARLLRGEVKPD
jgi:ABC-type transport system involved in multi-copper enzyme maturation permease subunit